MKAMNIEVCGWTVVLDAPSLTILNHLHAVVFQTSEWDPNYAHPIEDGLSWASAIADPHSGLTVDYKDDPKFGEQVRYVRDNAPAGFADECSLLAEEN